MGSFGQGHAPAALPSGKSHGDHCTGSWVGPGAGLMGVEKNLLPAPGFELRIHSARRESLRFLCYPGRPTPTGAPFFSSAPADSSDSSVSC